MVVLCEYCDAEMVRGEGVIKQDVLLCHKCARKTLFKLSNYKEALKYAKYMISMRENASKMDLLTRYNLTMRFSVKAAILYRLTKDEYFKEKMITCDNFFDTVTVDDLDRKNEVCR